MGVVISGEVVGGRRLGRRLGFPTANIAVAEGLEVGNGVYAARVEVDGMVWRAMANLGTNPSVGGAERRLEVHLLGYEGSLYGRRMDVELVEKIRDERCFASIGELQRQIGRDRETVENMEF